MYHRQIVNLHALSFLLVLLAPCVGAAAPDRTTENCEQIRARIGVAPLADPDLLRQLALRKDCRFTAAEVYRAAWGDKPPALEASVRGRHHHDDD
jgi:hypothetical protein